MAGSYGLRERRTHQARPCRALAMRLVLYRSLFVR